MNKAAQALGRLAKGVPKTLTDEQRKFRAEQLAVARFNRHRKSKCRAENTKLMDVESEPQRVVTGSEQRHEDRSADIAGRS